MDSSFLTASGQSTSSSEYTRPSTSTPTPNQTLVFLPPATMSKEIKQTTTEVTPKLIHIPVNRRCFQCPYCRFATNKGYRCQEHIEIFHKRESRSRRIQNSANQNKNLKKHVTKPPSDESDENIRYTCFTSQNCMYEFTKAAKFKKHLELLHWGEPPYWCEDCSYKSNKITAFFSHRVIHTGDRPFNCIECEQSYKKKHHLKQHWISHKKKFKCNYCTRKFRYKFTKARHEKKFCKQKPI
ncbi:hypothetical protein JTE90_022521 [Oedothorax gibbosus]|uniref:C2H2-type domain-containing protein n=1 Tax=Oedothorax gibbosus TaxID=931172 RepID=A0AAV6UZN8_9ARAC|nr:hypothetical protein JTE90_022521 [Oedothorax gibbosus]